MNHYLKLLKYKETMSFTHEGIRIGDFHLIEKANSFRTNIPLLLAFPFLKNFRGLALNVFKVTHHKNLNTYTIHPRHLSAHFKDESYLQVDMLLDSEVIRAESHSTESYSHVMLIINLIRLVTGVRSISGSDLHGRKDWAICRCCMALFQSLSLYRLHTVSCTAFGAGNIKRRVSNNILVHKTRIFLKKKNKFVPHVLAFNLKNLYRSIRPFSFINMDYESSNTPVADSSYSSFSKIPTNAIYEQKVIGGAYSIRNVFPNYPLPNSLATPRCIFINETQTEKDFYLSFFKKLRSDIKLIHRYEQDILSEAIPTPHLRDLSITEKIRYLSAQFCEVCQAKFNSYRTLDNGKKCRLHKNIDHDHVIFKKSMNEPDDGSVLRKVVCQFCNLQLTQSADSPKKSRIIYLHNAERYIIFSCYQSKPANLTNLTKSDEYLSAIQS